MKKLGMLALLLSLGLFAAGCKDDKKPAPTDTPAGTTEGDKPAGEGTATEGDKPAGEGDKPAGEGDKPADPDAGK